MKPQQADAHKQPAHPPYKWPTNAYPMHEFGVMPARATRSSRTAARVALSARIRDAEAVATGPLGALSHDELGVIFDGLADPLQPVVAVALSSTCLGLRTPLQAALEVLQQRHARALALCRKMSPGCDILEDSVILSWQSTSRELDWYHKGLYDDDMTTLGMLMTNWLPRLERIFLTGNGISDTGMRALCEGLGRGIMPSLKAMRLSYNQIGPAGAEALAAALCLGALPKLEFLSLDDNPIGSQGVDAMATPLRKLSALQTLNLCNCNFGDEAVASLVAGLGKDDFKALRSFGLSCNTITDAGLNQFVAAIDAGGLPELISGFTYQRMPLASDSAVKAVSNALVKRRQ